MPRFSHPAVPIALAAVLIDTIGFGVVIPVLPALVTRLGHVDLAHAATIGGWLLATFAITQFFAGPIIGNLGDRFGRRPVLIAAMLAFGIDYALMAWAPTLAWLFVGRAIAGMAGAIYAPAAAMIADVTPPEKRSATFGMIGAAFGIGFILGPGLGGLIAQFGPRAPFVAAAAMALVNAAVMTAIVPETLARENRRPFRLRDAHIVGAFRPLFAAGKAGPLLLAWLLWQLAHNVYYATWSFWAAITFGWDSTAIGWSLAFSGLVMAVVQGGLSGKVIARIGERRALVVGLTSGTCVFLLFAFARAGWQAYALFLLGACSGFVFPSMQGLLSRMVDATRQGALQGGVSSMGSIVMIVTPLMMTNALAIGTRHGFPGAAFLLASALAGIALVIVVTRVLRQVAQPATAPA
ncbi:MFS transporter [Sphingomonas sp. AR_OL41]|uniref:MFS transporter n=1 Tax=Sphingomonas sp. AR_OL41 TaxID=3042729 RepID=UPI002480C351|nr:MFS transporter [Sphingomonas sp. AR_OL41]MDH7973547.1 MFS transporter [Sphingomonas sp. AR_OL41]